MNNDKSILLTGATGFIGSYITRALAHSGRAYDTLTRRPDADICCNLEQDVPHIAKKYDVVIHAAGTNDPARADALNNHGTRRLLEGLEHNPPGQIIYLSCVDVYGEDPGEDVPESCFLRPDTPFSRSKIRAEKAVEKWCADHSTVCTILRPAAVIGNGMHGSYADMADKICRGYYMHIRHNESRRSLVMADDVAGATVELIGTPGVFNITDGVAHTLIEIADAMAANFSSDKRVLTMPRGLLKWGLRIVPVPRVKKAIMALTRTATYSNAKLCQTIDFKPYNVVEVMARRHPEYPYSMSEK